MNFSQKLSKLRKEHGMSQEELAEKLNVSRQAVSKWENGQGYPETDKLVVISGMFGVTLDYLLREEAAPAETLETEKSGDPGYYVNKETAEGYLAAKRRGARQIALGVAMIILSVICPVVIVNGWGAVAMLAVVAVGVAILVMQGFHSGDYRAVEEKSLVVDPAYLRAFREGYPAMRKRKGMLVVAGILLCFVGVIATVAFSQVYSGEKGIFAIPMFVFVAAGVGLIIMGGSGLEAGRIIAENEQYITEKLQENRYGWIYGILMPMAAAAFLFIGFMWRAWHPGWLVFLVAAFLGTAIVEVMKHRARNKL